LHIISKTTPQLGRSIYPYGDDVVIAVNDATVTYRLPTERITSAKEQVVRILTGKSTTYREFTALEHISLQIKRGEAVALIGRNGAGKSTLLKVIGRVQRPSKGKVWVRGTMASLIELGAGFHPELTGRENIFMNGAVLGFSQHQMQMKFDSIVSFAELEQFIDTPIRAYSTGMVARLGFAIAADVDPEILIIDEALSVGDEAFQKKCIARMQDFRRHGTTILYVTHSLSTLNTICPKAIWLESGRIRGVGPTAHIIQQYRDADDTEHGRHPEIPITLHNTVPQPSVTVDHRDAVVTHS